MPANIHRQPHKRSAKLFIQGASVTHLAVGVLAGIRAAFPPLMRAGGRVAKPLFTAAATHP